MKIMTFNVQSCINYKEQITDFEIIADTIKKCGAEIVGLNEVRSDGVRSDFVNQAGILSQITGLGNYCFAKAIDVDGEDNPYGNAFLSKYPIVERKVIPIPDPNPKTGDGYYESRCILKVKLENGLTVMVVHFGLNADEQINAVNTILENLETEKCILMGDFNVVPNNEILNPIREKMYDTADCFKASLLSFPSDLPEIKIDYIFVSHDIKVTAADIPAIVASDHRPHTAEIDF